MPAAVETAAFSDAKPAWHGLGTVLPAGEFMHVGNVLQTAGLDWDVMKDPVKNVRTGQIIPDRFAITRSSDDQFLGVVGSDYHTYQNREALDFLDNLVDSGDIQYESAGSLSGGKRVWIMCRRPEDLVVVGDQHAVYLFVTTSHDGSLAITAAATPVRIVCMNTLNIALAGAKQKWSVTHREGAQGKLAEAREALQLTWKYVEVFRQKGDKLGLVNVSEADFRAMLVAEFPEQKLQKEKNVLGIIENRAQSITIPDDQRGTAWGALNAMTEFIQHKKEYRSEEARMKAAIGGWQAQVVNKVAQHLLALV